MNGMRSFDICDTYNDRVLILGPDRSIEIPYKWGLAGPGGAWFTLLPAQDVPDEYVEEAKHCLRRNRDVVSLSVKRSPT